MAAGTTIAGPAAWWTASLEASRDRLMAAARGGRHDGVVAEVLALEADLLALITK